MQKPADRPAPACLRRPANGGWCCIRWRWVAEELAGQQPAARASNPRTRRAAAAACARSAKVRATKIVREEVEVMGVGGRRWRFQPECLRHLAGHLVEQVVRRRRQKPIPACRDRRAQSLAQHGRQPVEATTSCPCAWGRSAPRPASRCLDQRRAQEANPRRAHKERLSARNGAPVTYGLGSAHSPRRTHGFEGQDGREAGRLLRCVDDGQPERHAERTRPPTVTGKCRRAAHAGQCAHLHGRRRAGDLARRPERHAIRRTSLTPALRTSTIAPGGGWQHVKGVHRRQRYGDAAVSGCQRRSAVGSIGASMGDTTSVAVVSVAVACSGAGGLTRPSLSTR